MSLLLVVLHIVVFAVILTGDDAYIPAGISSRGLHSSANYLEYEFLHIKVIMKL